MIKNIEQIANHQAGPVHSLKEKREIRAVKEKEPKPERQAVNAEDWVEERQALVREQWIQKAKDLVAATSRQIATMWNSELLKQTLWENLLKLSLAERDGILHYIQEPLEAEIYSRPLDDWAHRLEQIDREIVLLEANHVPKPFSPDMINKDTLYPASRCLMEAGKYYDAWLTKYLDSKKPIYFEPHSAWLDSLEKFYHQVYLVEYQKDQEAKAAPPPPAEPEVIGAFSDGPNSVLLAREFYEKEGSAGQHGQPELSWTKQRIYKGGGK